MSSSFPPFSDLTSLYLSPLFASGSLRSSAEQPTSRGTASPINAPNYPTSDSTASLHPHSQLSLSTSSHPLSQPHTSTSQTHSPAAAAKMQRRSSALRSEPEDVHEEPLLANATQMEHIQRKRRQNTLAARKSRKRKQEHLAYLEGTVERLKAEVETWKVRAQTYQAILKNHGIVVADLA